MEKAGLFTSAALAAAPAALARAPLAYLSGHGPQADTIAPLTWGLLAVSVAVVVITSTVLVIGIFVRRADARAPGLEPLQPGGGGLSWIYIGLALTTVLLAGALVWTMVVLARINGPARPPALTIQVTGRQWWWEVRYLGDSPGQAFSTANEIHIPVGQPVRLRLTGGDVIHSFWVPALSGKMDTIPGRTNLTWIEARQAGVYRGQCSEFCGVQHAHMTLEVVAQSPADFQRWLAFQRLPAADPLAPDEMRGLHVLAGRCGRCHAVRGAAPHGVTGPDLTHLMSRRMLAGTLANNRGNLTGWIANPQALKPGTHMPTAYLSPAELSDVRAYLETLR